MSTNMRTTDEKPEANEMSKAELFDMLITFHDLAIRDLLEATCVLKQELEALREAVYSPNFTGQVSH